MDFTLIIAVIIGFAICAVNVAISRMKGRVFTSKAKWLGIFAALFINGLLLIDWQQVVHGDVPVAGAMLMMDALFTLLGCALAIRLFSR